MALFDKIGAVAKNIGEKTTAVAKNIGEKTGDAIEVTKLQTKIHSERNALADDYKKIGEYYFNYFQAGGEVAPEIAEICGDAKAHVDAIAQLEEDIQRIKTDDEPAAEAPAPEATAPVGITCPACGKLNEEGTKFCGDCGAKLEA